MEVFPKMYKVERVRFVGQNQTKFMFETTEKNKVTRSFDYPTEIIFTYVIVLFFAIRPF